MSIFNGVIETDLSNYYGSVEFVQEDGKFFMRLEDHSDYAYKEISQEFYEAAFNEFILKLADN